MNKAAFISILIGILINLACNKKIAQGISYTANPNIQQIINDFQQQIKYDVTQDNIGSISSAIFIGDKIVWSKSFGKADYIKGIEADTSTVYRTASISKTITAYLLMLLVQDGTVLLDDPIEKYLPEIKLVKQNGMNDPIHITFCQLANHTSGLAEEPELLNAASGPINEWENKVLSSIPTITLNSPAGIKFSYSNIGYAILGLALSRAAHKPFIELVEERVFKPLHMTNSFFIIPKEFESSVATGYQWDAFTGQIDAKKAQTEHAGRGYKVPNGGIYATPNDLARFLIAQVAQDENPVLLSKKYRDMMQSIQTPESKEYGYGFGFYIRKNDKGIKMVEHDGGVAGYNAFMVFNPESRMGVILMRNYDFGLTNMLLEPRTLLSELVKAKNENK